LEEEANAPLSIMSKTGLLALGGVGEAIGGLRVGFGGMDGVDRAMGGEVAGVVDDFEEKDETREETGDSGPLRSGVVGGCVAWICSVSIVTVFV